MLRAVLCKLKDFGDLSMTMCERSNCLSMQGAAAQQLPNPLIAGTLGWHQVLQETGG